MLMSVVQNCFCGGKVLDSFSERIRLTLNQPINPYGLAVFRVLFSLVMLGEVVQLFFYRHLIFDPKPYLETGFFSPSWIYVPWFAALLGLTLGVMTRACSIINYLFATVILGHNLGSFVYHMDWYMIQIPLVMMFLPLDSALCLKTFLNPDRRHLVPLWCHAVIVLPSIAFVYGDSLFHKLDSEMWLNGLSLWLPCSLPQTCHFAAPLILEYPSLIRGMSYAVFFFEFIFCILVWFPSCRLLLALFGIPFHLGVAILFPIPFFGIGVAAVYLLLLPHWVWQRCVPVADELPVSYSLTKNRMRLVVAVLAAAGLMQCMYLLHTSRIVRCVVPAVIGQQSVGIMETMMNRTLLDRVTGLTGLAPHYVYIDVNFKEFDHNIAVANPSGATREFLPIINQSGHLNWKASGRVFVNWSYRVNNPNISSAQLRNGLSRYAYFWAHHGGIDLRDGKKFDILYQRVESSLAWKPKLLGQNLKQPWHELGTIAIRNEVAVVSLPGDIEILE